MLRDVVLENSRAVGGANAGGIHQVLVRDGKPVQWTEDGAARLHFVCFAGVLDSLLRDQRDDRVHLGIDAFDLLEMSVHCFARAEFLAANLVRHFGGAHETNVGSGG